MFFRLMLSFSIAILATIIREHIIWNNGETQSVIVVAILGAALLVQGTCSIYVLAVFYSILRGRCKSCNGSGTVRILTGHIPYLWPEDIQRLQPESCRHCGYDL